jgi:hypothetical protein
METYFFFIMSYYTKKTMPLKHGYNKNGQGWYAWGKCGTKYHYKTSDVGARKRAKTMAMKDSPKGGVYRATRNDRVLPRKKYQFKRK